MKSAPVAPTVPPKDVKCLINCYLLTFFANIPMYVLCSLPKGDPIQKYYFLKCFRSALIAQKGAHRGVKSMTDT